MFEGIHTVSRMCVYTGKNDCLSLELNIYNDMLETLYNLVLHI